jgi:hypothetical protein
MLGSLFTDDILAGLLEQSLVTATLGSDGWKDVGAGPGSVAGKFIKWHTIANLEQSVVDPPTRTAIDPHLWLYIRRKVGPIVASSKRYCGRQTFLSHK